MYSCMYVFLLEVTKQLTCMKQSCCTSNQFSITTYMYSSYIHVFCLVTSNRLGAVPSQDSICTCRPHGALSGHILYTLCLHML